jgi:carboxylate-amine ligase
MLAGLVRALVQTCYEEARNSAPIPVVRPELLRAAHWRAARYGISDGLVDVVEPRLLPAAELLEKMLATLRPALQKSGDWEEISALVHQTIRRGNGAMRQRAVYEQHGRMEDVVEYMAAQTRQGIS